MKIRPALLATPVLIVLSAAAGWVAWSLDPAQAQAPPQESTQAPTRSAADQRAIDELVLANRMLASPLLGVLDAFGHVSVRVPSNPNHYFIARYISAGLVTAADIIENDLDSRSVAGTRGLESRNDEYQERFIHGEIYKARPDVMAVLHSHTPELVAFGVSSIPFHTDRGPLPIFDIRPLNNGRPGILTTPAMGRALAESLGKREAVLLLGHGAVLVDPSIYGLVHAANAIRKTAQVQQQVIALGKPNYVEMASPAPASPAASPPATKQIRIPNGSGGGAGDDRAWEYWRQLFAPGVAQTRQEVPLGAPSSNPVIADLVLANRMLASQELGVLDAEGHVSVRNPANPNHYFITRYVSAGSATAADIIENDLDNKPVAGERNDQYQERFMHGEVYKARPDVMAIVHAHTPEILAFAQSMTPLRPVVNSGTFIAYGLPIFDIRKFNGGTQQRIVTTPVLGHALATVLGNRPAVLMQGHGVLVVDSSLPGVVSRAYGLRMNARIEQQAIALGGSVTYLDTLRGPSSPAPATRTTRAAPAVPNAVGGGAGGDRAWDYWKHLVLDQ